MLTRIATAHLRRSRTPPATAIATTSTPLGPRNTAFRSMTVPARKESLTAKTESARS